MENNKRFRNHISIILPNLKGVLWIIVMSFASVFWGDTEEGLLKVVVSLVIAVVIVVGFITYQMILWAKTWITIQEQSIVIECNTLFVRRKNTIGIANISNINLEQGLIAMLLGTCKLKLDTNSLSTAETTDVTIVLKKKDAEELRRLLMTQVSDKSFEEDVAPEGQDESKEITTDKTKIDSKDILLHGLFASRFLYTVFVPLFILLEFATEIDAGDLDYLINEVGTFAAETVGLGFLILIVIVFWGVLAGAFSLIRSVIKYWDFRIERKEEKLVLEYGLMNKVNYSIPVDKIQAIILRQTLLARICKRYMVEVVNVGMNDDQNETQAFLLPYGSKAITKTRLEKLLPEFADYMELESEREPKGIWVVWLWPVVIYLLVVGTLVFGVVEIIPEFLGIACGGIAIISIALLATKVAGYVTKGTKFDERVLLVTNGAFARDCVFIKYDKIQHICLKQNFLAKQFGIQKGTVHLLASAKNQVQVIPYFPEEQIESLKSRCLLCQDFDSCLGH